MKTRAEWGKALKRIVPVLAMVLVGAGASVTMATPAQAACGTVVDIGYTVQSGGYIKGSGSYTSEQCLAIDVVSLVIQRDGSNTDTVAYRYPSEPSSAAFSPKDYKCTSSSWHDYRTVIQWTYQGGGSNLRISNTIHVQC